MESNEIKISVKIPADEHSAIKQKLARESTGFQEVGLNLFRRWLSGEFAPEEPFGAITEREKHYLELLLSILREAREPEWILANLAAWEKLRERRNRGPSD